MAAPAPAPLEGTGGPPAAATSTKPTVDTVVVHPLVLLSVTDHYNRVAKDTRKRVVGVLLGETHKGRVDVTNCFAVPFEEDPKDQRVFFLDHDYLEAMFEMHKKVSARERIVGFYSTGPKIRPADIDIDALFRGRKYSLAPVLVIVDVRPDTEGLPVAAYQSVENFSAAASSAGGNGGAASTADVAAVRTFAHVSSEVGAYEAEEVGVEHLLRDINDPSVSTLAGEARHKLSGLRGLVSRLGEVSAYLGAVGEGKLPPNPEIMYAIQSVLTALPNMNVASLSRALTEATNDQHLALYVASLTRSVLALHDLVNNKAAYRDVEEGGNGADGKDGKEGDKKKEGADGKDGKKEGAPADAKKGGK